MTSRAARRARWGDSPPAGWRPRMPPTASGEAIDALPAIRVV
ncbi:hypothetical protein [Sorangium sp. So ce426]